MAKSYEVLEMLIPQGGWVIVGNDFAGITFLECDPITEEEFNAGFDKYDAWKSEQDAARAAKKDAILERIGLSAEELKTILG
jgi:hypothetical protein